MSRTTFQGESTSTKKSQATALLAEVGCRIPEATEKASSAPSSMTGGRRGGGWVTHSYPCNPETCHGQILSPTCLHMAGKDPWLPLPFSSCHFQLERDFSVSLIRSGTACSFLSQGKALARNGSLGKPGTWEAAPLAFFPLQPVGIGQRDGGFGVHRK